MRYLIHSSALTLALVASASFAGQPELPNYSEDELALYDQDEQDYYRWAQSFLHELNYQDGLIELPGGKVQLQVPEAYYYLSPEDSGKVLVDAWGNIPGDELPLGMLFPADHHPLSGQSWGMIIEYSDDGHVSDKDAAKIDYDDLQKQIRKDTEAENEYRLEHSYEAIEFIGWAEQPYYDSQGKKLHWAQEYHFGDSESNTLNYKIRVLGREGVLELNAIAGMDQLDQVNGALDDILKIPSFTKGNTYAEFNPNLDRIAAYGIGGLIAGKVLAKTGLIAAGLLLFKKFFVIIAVVVSGLFKTLLGRKKQK
jgi:uncharacterized membrane-anchored protein